jgi:predicted kinase
LAAALGDCIARDHAARPLVAHWDSAAGLAEAADGCVASASAAGLPAEPMAAWHQDFRATLEQYAALLAARAACGHVRRCHGDLHAGNILLWHGAPLPFDALEFDEALATIDVGYDLAFLLMDIDYSVGRWAANRVFNRYIARTGDAGIAGPMAMFMSLRACVRAHVEAARGHPGPAHAYLSAAAADLAPAPCVLVAVGGLPGSGKSTLARRLAPRIGAAPGAALLRSDEVRKQQAGVAPETKLPASAYSAAAKDATAALHLARIGAALGGGHTVIADATFLAAADRHAVAAIAASQGVPFIGLWLRAPPDVLRARVRARAHDASDADAGVLEAALARPTGDISWHMIDATSGDDALAEAAAAIGALTPIKADRCTAA